MSRVVEIESKEGLTEIVGRCQFVVVDFYAPWCGPCKTIAPRFVALAAEFPETAFVKVNVDELGDVAEELGVESLPTFVFFKAGVEVGRCGAAEVEARVRSW